MSLPSGYKRLEYIQSSGGQYIDTGVVPGSDNFSISAKFQAMQDPSGADNWFVTIGHSKPSGSASYAQFGTWQSKWAIHLTNVVVEGVAASTNIVNITFGVNGNVASISGDASHSITNPSFRSGSYRNQNITIVDGIWKCFECKIHVGGLLVRDFVPCINNDGTIGLWDDVNSVFYGNDGTGTFAAGPEIPLPAAPAGLQTVLAVVLQWAASANADRYDVYRDGAKLGSTEGTQYVDTTPEANQTYVYTVKAVNAGGESAGTSITVYTKSGYFEYKPLIESANFP